MCKNKIELHVLKDKVIYEDILIKFLEVLSKDFYDDQEKEKENPNSPYWSGNLWMGVQAFFFVATLKRF